MTFDDKKDWKIKELEEAFSSPKDRQNLDDSSLSQEEVGKEIQNLLQEEGLVDAVPTAETETESKDARDIKSILDQSKASHAISSSASAAAAAINAVSSKKLADTLEEVNTSESVGAAEQEFNEVQMDKEAALLAAESEAEEADDKEKKTRSSHLRIPREHFQSMKKQMRVSFGLNLLLSAAVVGLTAALFLRKPEQSSTHMTPIPDHQNVLMAGSANPEAEDSSKDESEKIIVENPVTISEDKKELEKVFESASEEVKETHAVDPLTSQINEQKRYSNKSDSLSFIEEIDLLEEREIQPIPLQKIADKAEAEVEESKRVEESLKAEAEAKKAEEEAKKAAEESRRIEESILAEEARLAAEESKRVEESQKAEQESILAEESKKAEEEAKRIEESKKAEAEASKKAEEESIQAEEATKASEEASAAAESKETKESEAVEETVASEKASGEKSDLASLKAKAASPSFAQITASPDEYLDKLVVSGGQIIEIKNGVLTVAEDYRAGGITFHQNLWFIDVSDVDASQFARWQVVNIYGYVAEFKEYDAVYGPKQGPVIKAVDFEIIP